MRNHIDIDGIDLIDLEPVVFLEGGYGLDLGESFLELLRRRQINTYVLDNLYEDPDKLKTIPHLKPKAIVVSTTGTYTEPLENLKEIFMGLNYLPEVVIFLMGEEYFKGLREKVKELKPEIRFYKMYIYPGWGNEPDTIEVDEIN